MHQIMLEIRYNIEQIRYQFHLFKAYVFNAEVKGFRFGTEEDREIADFRAIPGALNYNRFLLAYLIYDWLSMNDQNRKKNKIELMREDGLDIDRFISDQWLGGMSIRQLQKFYKCGREQIRDSLLSRGHVIRPGRHTYLPGASYLKRLYKRLKSFRAVGRIYGVTGQTIKAQMKRPSTPNPPVALRPKTPTRKICGCRSSDSDKLERSKALALTRRGWNSSLSDFQLIADVRRWCDIQHMRRKGYLPKNSKRLRDLRQRLIDQGFACQSV